MRHFQPRGGKFREKERDFERKAFGINAGRIVERDRSGIRRHAAGVFRVWATSSRGAAHALKGASRSRTKPEATMRCTFPAGLLRTCRCFPFLNVDRSHRMRFTSRNGGPIMDELCSRGLKGQPWTITESDTSRIGSPTLICSVSRIGSRSCLRFTRFWKNTKQR